VYKKISKKLFFYCFYKLKTIENMNKNMVTFIDELPSMSEIDDGNMYPMIPPAESNKIKRMIRNHDHNIPIESGMNTKSHQMFQEEEMQRKMFEDEQQRQMQEQQMQMQMQEQQQIREPYLLTHNHDDDRRKKRKRHQHFDDDLSCISVAEHTTNCVVCSKLYNDDRSIYSGVIIVLLIISLILLKKVVEK